MPRRRPCCGTNAQTPSRILPDDAAVLSHVNELVVPRNGCDSFRAGDRICKLHFLKPFDNTRFKAANKRSVFDRWFNEDDGLLPEFLNMTPDTDEQRARRRFNRSDRGDDDDDDDEKKYVLVICIVFYRALPQSSHFARGFSEFKMARTYVMRTPPGFKRRRIDESADQDSPPSGRIHRSMGKSDLVQLVAELERQLAERDARIRVLENNQVRGLEPSCFAAPFRVCISPF